MNTKLKISQTVNAPTLVEKEIDLPYCFKQFGTHWKIESSDRVITAYACNDYASITFRTLDRETVSEMEKGETITAEDFETTFQSALNKIQSCDSAAKKMYDRLNEMNIDLNIMYCNMLDAEKSNTRFEGYANLIQKWIEANDDSMSLYCKQQTPSL